MKQKTIFSIAAAALILLFFGATQIYQSQSAKEAVEQARENQSLLMRPNAPTLGNENAPVVIVEFLDPACETCSAFYPMVKQLMARHPDRIRLVLRYAPFHEGSDKVVAMLEAARRQDKFWPALEALLGSQAAWTQHHTVQPAQAWTQLEKLGLNMEQMVFDLTSPDIATTIARDLADARGLNVTKTPEFFVNGQPLPSFGFAQLESMVNAALAKAAK